MGHKKRRNVAYVPFFTFTPPMIYVVQKGLRLLEAPLEHTSICDVQVAFAQETMVQVKGKLSALLASAGTGHTTTFDYNEKVMITSAVQLYSLLLVGKPPSERQAKELRYILAHDLGYVFGHSFFAGKTSRYEEEEQNVRSGK